MNKVMGNKLAILLFIFPALAVFTIVVPIPILNSIYLSFFDWNILSPKSYVGMTNFIDLFKDEVFIKSIFNTFMIAIVSVVLQVAVALFLALFICSLKKARNFFQSAYYLPNVLSSAVIGIIWYYVLNYDTGLVNSVLRLIGLDALTQDWLSQKTAIASIIIVVCWQWVGYHMILYVAAISNISTDVIEAAKVDGVYGIKMATKIIIPLIWPIMRVTMILMVIGSLKFFDMAWIMTQGGPNHATETMATYLYVQAFWNMKIGYGSAVSTVMFVLCIVASVILNKVFHNKKFDY